MNLSRFTSRCLPAFGQFGGWAISNTGIVRQASNNPNSNLTPQVSASIKPMREYLSNDTDRFLKPDESNFNTAVSIAVDLQKEVTKHTTDTSARINFDPKFNYTSEVEKFSVPDVGKKDQKVVEEITDAFVVFSAGIR